MAPSSCVGSILSFLPHVQNILGHQVATETSCRVVLILPRVQYLNADIVLIQKNNETANKGAFKVPRI
jgi:hypothetical protein